MLEPVPHDITEIQRIIAGGTTPYIEQFLRRELSKLIARFPPNPESAAPRAPAVPRRSYEPIESYAFSDSNDKASVIISGVEGLADAKIDFDPKPHSFSIVIDRQDSGLASLKLTVSPLYKKIVPEESRFSVKGKTLTIVLDKKKKTTWTKLKKGAPDKKKKPPTADVKEDPNASLMNLMKTMYDEGDDEMKRTIQKAMWEAQNKRDGEK
jgi:calcyclin binding protein